MKCEECDHPTEMKETDIFKKEVSSEFGTNQPKIEQIKVGILYICTNCGHEVRRLAKKSER